MIVKVNETQREDVYYVQADDDEDEVRADASGRKLSLSIAQLTTQGNERETRDERERE